MPVGAKRALGAVIVACFACGGEAPKVVTPPPLHVTATPPAAERARWVFAHPERGLVAELRLDGRRTLYVGKNGRRELADGAKVTDAPTLAIGDLTGVVRDDQGRFVFVGGDGATYVAKGPLGPLDPLHPAPPKAEPHARSWVETGKRAILVITRDRELLRSSDFGATWRAVDYAGASKPYGRPAAVALDSKGNGVLVHFPQRLYVTHDDGATWAPLGSLHIGARTVERDADDHVFVTGYGGAHARLEGDALVATADSPKPISIAPVAAHDDVEGRHRTLITGARFVELAEVSEHGKVRAIEVASAPLGAKIGAPAPSTDLVGRSGLSRLVAAFGADIVYLRDDDDADATDPTTTVFRSKDYGATWRKEAQLKGVAPVQEEEGLDLAAGPKGWVYVTSLCPEDVRSGAACSRRQIRPAGATAFEDLAFVEEFVPEQFAFDEAHDRVYAVGLRNGRQYVYESPLAQNKFTRTKLLDASRYPTIVLTVNGKGEPRVLESNGGVWTLHRGDARGAELPPLYFELPRGRAAFAGPRGVLFTLGGEGWETADAGESWIRVATNGYPQTLACSDAGCINGDAQRVGWDLPALHPHDVVTAKPERPKTSAPPAPPPAKPPVDVACKVAGAGTPVTSPPGEEMVDGATADRWASIKYAPDGRVSVVVGTAARVRELPLLGAPAKPKPHAPTKEQRQGSHVAAEGVVVARYHFSPLRTRGRYNPVDVELAWWSAATGRTHRRTLPAVAPFRVSRFRFSGGVAIVDGGLLFQGAPNDQAYFVRDDGKVERISLPEQGEWRAIERAGKRWIVADSYGGTVRLSTSDDGGKSWKQVAWGLDLSGEVGLTRTGNHVALAFQGGMGSPLLFDLGAVLPDDPPAPVVSRADAVAATCDGHAGRRRFSRYLPSGESPIRVSIVDGKGAAKHTMTYSPSVRIAHDAPGGTMCATAYTMNATDTFGGRYDYQTVFVYPQAKGAWTGWRFRHASSTHSLSYVAEPLTCK
jgi:hypothetical protein